MKYKFINQEYLDSVAEGDASVVKEIVDIFRDQADEIYEEMTRLKESKNYEALGLLAHKAKSSVAIMGSNDLALRLKEFELKARNSIEIDHYQSYIVQFRNEIDEALIELEDLIVKMSGIQDDKN